MTQILFAFSSNNSNSIVRFKLKQKRIERKLTGEIGGNPAVNLLSAELPIGNNDGEDDENGHSVFIVNTVGEIVIVPLDAKHQNGHSSHYAENIHA